MSWRSRKPAASIATTSGAQPERLRQRDVLSPSRGAVTPWQECALMGVRAGLRPSASGVSLVSALAPRPVGRADGVLGTDNRKLRVQKAVQESVGRSEQDFKVAVLTFAEAARKLATYLPPRPAQPPAPTPGQALPKPATATAGRAAPPAAAPGPVSLPRVALAVDERDLRLLRDSYRRLEEALQDAYAVVDEHQKNAHCQLDLDRLPRYELDYLRKIILNERPDARAAPPAHKGVR